LAVALYLDGRLLRSYSTLDIAGTPKNVRPSSNHYEVFEAVEGYAWDAGQELFRVHTVDGRVLSFSTETGRLVSSAVDGSKK